MRFIILEKGSALKFCSTSEARLELRYDVNNDAIRIHCIIESYSSIYVELLEYEVLHNMALLNDMGNIVPYTTPLTLACVLNID